VFIVNLLASPRAAGFLRVAEYVSFITELEFPIDSERASRICPPADNNKASLIVGLK
jgi:hypothetical protein